MEKGRKIIIIAVAIILVLVVAGVLYFNLIETEIPEAYNLMVEIDWLAEPSNIETYYFFDDYIIESNFSSGVLADGVVTNETTTKYSFDEKVDLYELEKFIQEKPKETYAAVRVVEKNGNSYYIDDIDESNSNRLMISHSELLNIISKITQKAYKKEVLN